MESQIDEIDMKILRSLNQNARKSYREIAKELKISLSTVANRIKKLESEKIIRGYMPLIDFGKIGYEYMAIISIRMSKGGLLETQKKIGHDPHTFEVYDVTGDWDSIIIARFRTRDELNLYKDKLISMEVIERINTRIVLNVVKSERKAKI